MNEKVMLKYRMRFCCLAVVCVLFLLCAGAGAAGCEQKVKSKYLNDTVKIKVVAFDGEKACPLLLYLPGGQTDGVAPSEDFVLEQCRRFGFHFATFETNNDDVWLALKSSTDKFYTEELLTAIRKKVQIKKDQFAELICVLGLQEAGYGAVRLHLNHPEIFASASALNPYVNIEAAGNKAANLAEYAKVISFDGTTLIAEKLDLETLAAGKALNIYTNMSATCPRIDEWRKWRQKTLDNKLNGDFVEFSATRSLDTYKEELKYHMVYHWQRAELGSYQPLWESCGIKGAVNHESPNIEVANGQEVYPGFKMLKFKTANFNDRVMRNFIYVPESQNEHERFPVVYLLPAQPHNLSAYGNWGWYRYTHLLEYARKFRMILVLCEFWGTWYADSPIKTEYQSESYFIREVIPKVDELFPTIKEAGARAIVGFSKGGHGAPSLHLRNLDTIGCSGAMEGVLQLRLLLNSAWGKSLRKNSFGEPSAAGNFWDTHDSWQLVQTKRDILAGRRQLMFGGGNNDSWVSHSVSMNKKLLELGVPHRFDLRRGMHNWVYWDHTLVYYLQFFENMFDNYLQRNKKVITRKSGKPGFEVSTDRLSFVQGYSRSGSQKSLRIKSLGRAKRRWEISEDCDWLEITPQKGIATKEGFEVVVKVDSKSLAKGQHSYELKVIDPKATNDKATIVRVELRAIAVENLTTGKTYDYIKPAITDANDGEEIVVRPGFYYGGYHYESEKIDFEGKNITLRSINPTDPAVVAATILNGNVGYYYIYDGSDSVTFSGGEDANCVLNGFTVTGGMSGIYCAKDASPTIINCAIVENKAEAVRSEGNPTFTNCTIERNEKVKTSEYVN